MFHLNGYCYNVNLQLSLEYFDGIQFNKLCYESKQGDIASISL